MKFSYQNHRTLAQCYLFIEEPGFDRVFYGRDRKDKLLTIAWNRGKPQDVTIDGIRYDFPGNSMLCLMVNQSFRFSAPGDIVAWQFNRDFYCIVDHDREVSCVGFLFYGSAGPMFIALRETELRKMQLLLDVFSEEFAEVDGIQEDMLRMLLKRLIIIVTRLAKQQHLPEDLSGQKLDIVRRYNLLVENSYKTQHGVQFYADQLNRSPKTLSNLFAQYNLQSPLAIIRQRIFLEAKRLLIFTDLSSKEISYELGFNDVAYFNHFFKKMASVAPAAFRKDKEAMITGSGH